MVMEHPLQSGCACYLPATVGPMDALPRRCAALLRHRNAAAARADVLLVVGGWRCARRGAAGAAPWPAAASAACRRWWPSELASALRGFEPLPQAALGTALRADTAVIVFERARRNNGRDDAFVQPQPEQLAALAQTLRAGGVRRLLVVVPHAPALLPQALKAGLASLDEGRVAALGFEQLLFVRAAQAASGSRAVGWAQRLAAGWLSQMAWMVPQREQPVRALRLAELVVELAWRLPQAAPATRVLAPELLWQAAQASDGGACSAPGWPAKRCLPLAAPTQRW